MAVLECNRTVQTMMVWFAYEVILSHNVPFLQKYVQVELTKGGNGMVEKLSEIQVSYSFFCIKSV